MKCETESEFLYRLYDHSKLIVEAGAAQSVIVSQRPSGIHLAHFPGVGIKHPGILKVLIPH